MTVIAEVFLEIILKAVKAGSEYFWRTVFSIKENFAELLRPIEQAETVEDLLYGFARLGILLILEAVIVAIILFVYFKRKPTKSSRTLRRRKE